MFEFARPWVLLMLFPLLALAWGRLRIPGLTLIQVLPEDWVPFAGSRLGPPLPWLIRVLAVGFLILGLAGPRMERPAPAQEGVTVLFALDLSGSMDTRDMAGRSRLAVAREEVRRFILARPGDLLGLVTFSREAVTRVPPTTDHAHLLRILDALEVEAEANGTALGTGLGLAAQRALQAPSISRALVLITDGRNNTGFADPLSVAGAVGDLEMRVHCVGVGGDGGEDPLDEALLARVSARTGGRYFRARDGKAFREVMAQVDALETSPIPAEVTPEYRPLQSGVLKLGALLLLLEGILWALPGRRCA